MIATARKPKPPLESVVLKDCMAVYRRLGIPAWRRNVGGMSGTHKGRSWYVKYGEPGQCDTWGLIPDGHGKWPFHFEGEIKRPGKKPTLDQTLWLRSINDRTGRAFWADSAEILESVVRALMSGGCIRYLDTEWRYGKFKGPGADFDVDLAG